MPALSFLGAQGSGHGPCSPTNINEVGQSKVTVGGIVAARQGDKLVPHSYPEESPHQRVIAMGSTKVTIAGAPAARVADPIACGGMVAQGNTNVNVGG